MARATHLHFSAIDMVWHHITSHQAGGFSGLAGLVIFAIIRSIGHDYQTLSFVLVAGQWTFWAFSSLTYYLSALGLAYQACIGRMGGSKGRGPGIMIWIILHSAWYSELSVILREFVHAYDRLHEYGLIELFAWFWVIEKWEIGDEMNER